VFDTPMRQGEYILLLEKSIAFLILRKNTARKLFDELKTKKDFRFRKLEFKNILELDQLLKLENQFF